MLFRPFERELDGTGHFFAQAGQARTVERQLDAKNLALKAIDPQLVNFCLIWWRLVRLRAVIKPMALGVCMSDSQYSAEFGEQSDPLDADPSHASAAGPIGGTRAALKRGLNNLNQGLKDGMSSKGLWGVGVGVGLLLLGAGPLAWAIMALGAAVMVQKAMAHDHTPELPRGQSPAADRSPSGVLEKSDADPSAALDEVASAAPARAGQVTPQAGMDASAAYPPARNLGSHYRDARFNPTAPALHAHGQAGGALGHHQTPPLPSAPAPAANPTAVQVIAGANVVGASFTHPQDPNQALHYTDPLFNSAGSLPNAHAPQTMMTGQIRTDRAPATMM